MFVLMPQRDLNCLQMPVHVKLVNADVCMPTEHKLYENPTNGHKKIGRTDGFVRLSLVKNAKLILKRDAEVCKGSEKFGDSKPKFKSEERVHGVKGKTRRSTKKVAYGGRVSLILQALEIVDDLDKALKPWEDSLSNKERSIILKEQTNWRRALEIFEWFKGKACHELNVIHYNILLWIVGKARRWNHIERLLGEMETEGIMPTNCTYGTLIDVYGKAGSIKDALLWLSKMYKQGLELDEVTVGIVIQTYKKARLFAKAEQLFRMWLSGNSVGERHQRLLIYNTLIDTYGKAGLLKEASKTFAKMLSAGIAPSTVTFNTMIHIYGNHGHMEEVASFLNKMENLRCFPDTRTYNILISLHVKHGNIDEAMSYFRKMKLIGMELDIVSYRTLLYAFSVRYMVREAEALVIEMVEQGLEVDEYTHSSLTRMYVGTGMLEQSWAWFERFHNEGKMSSECYSANIDAFGERGHLLEAERVFLCSQERRRLTVMEFNVMIKAYGIGKEWNKACQLFEDMKKYDIFPDACTCNSVIQILSSAELPCKAMHFLREMQEMGSVNDCVPYCAVMSGFLKLGQLKLAEDVFKEMVGKGVKPDIIAFGILINAFADVGSVKEANAYCEAMKRAGFHGNSIIYNSLIKLYTKVGYLQEAQETYKLLQMSYEGPDIYASNCMIDLYTERIMVGHAEEIFEYLKQRRETNEFSFGMMLCMYKKIGRVSQAIGVAHEMNELGLLTDVLSFNNVIGLYALDGKLKEAAGAFFQMIDSGIQPNDSTFRPLRGLLIKSGVSKEVINKLEQERVNNTQIGLHAWMMTLYYMIGNG